MKKSNVGGGVADWISEEGIQWLFYFVKRFGNCRKCEERRSDPMTVYQTSSSQVIIPIDLCISLRTALLQSIVNICLN